MIADLVSEYPQYPNLHYLYGTMLLGSKADDALVEFRKELEIQPDHLPSLISIAMEYLNRKDPEQALDYAQHAVRTAPLNFTAHAAYGRTLVELDRAKEGIPELETAAKLAPDSPQVFLALATAYQKVGRKEDAAKAREQFARLRKLLDAQKAQ